MSRTLHLAEQLISLPSITPEDAGCLDLLAARLAPLGFVCERLDSGPADFRVSNLWAKRPLPRDQLAQAAIKTIVFAGHTDVVPTGPLAQWGSDPFVPTHKDGKLYGRGASDMKTSIAAFVVAVEEFLAATPEPLVQLAFLLTSDEEGPSVDGTKVVVEQLKARGEPLDYCIVGEPTSVEKTGDMIKNGRRGTLSGKLSVRGIQATSPTRNSRATPSTKPCPRWQSWPPRCGTTATPSSHPPAGRSATCTAAPAPPM